MRTRHLVRLHFLPWLLLMVALHLLFSAPAAGQTAPQTGTIAGAVLGPDGARLPGVLVSIERGGRIVSQVVSGDEGGFHISGVEPGNYELRACLSGFHTVTTSVAVSPRRVTMIDLTLPLEALTESIVVAARLPRDSVEAPRLAESGARDVGEALASTAGISKVRRGAVANDIVLRGYQNDNLSVMIDGVRLYGACPNNMDHAPFHVDFAEVDRVEIAKGPFDVKNQGALGGIVNIVTKRPGPGFHARPQLAVGSFGYVNPSATVSYGNDRLAVLGGYSYRTSKPYRDGAGRSMLAGANYRASAGDLDAFSVNTGWARADAQPAPGHNVLITATRQDAGVILYPYLQMDAVTDDATRGKAGWEITRRLGRVETMRTDVFVTDVSHFMSDGHRQSSVSSPAGYSMATTARSGSAGFRAEAALSTNLTAGVEAYRRDWATETRLAASAYRVQYSIPDAHVSAAGAFAEYFRPVTTALRLDLGGRFDRVAAAADPGKANTALYTAYHGLAATAATDVYPTGKIRLSWQVDPWVSLSGGIGRTARVPDPQERYFGLVRMGTDWTGNPALRPTFNTGVEIALSIRRPRAYLSVTAHRDALGDYITVYQQPRIQDVPGVVNRLARSYRNVDATMTGGEIEGTFSLTDRLALSGALDAVRGRQIEDAAAGVPGGNLAEIPPVRSRLALRYDVRSQRSGMFGEVELAHAASQTRVDGEVREEPTPAYSVVNLRAGATYRVLRVVVGLTNLLNRTYVEHLSYQRDPFRSGAKVYEPGRNVFVNTILAF